MTKVLAKNNGKILMRLTSSSVLKTGDDDIITNMTIKYIFNCYSKYINIYV